MSFERKWCINNIVHGFSLQPRRVRAKRPVAISFCQIFIVRSTEWTKMMEARWECISPDSVLLVGRCYICAHCAHASINWQEGIVGRFHRFCHLTERSVHGRKCSRRTLGSARMKWEEIIFYATGRKLVKKRAVCARWDWHAANKDTAKRNEKRRKMEINYDRCCVRLAPLFTIPVKLCNVVHKKAE